MSLATVCQCSSRRHRPASTRRARPTRTTAHEHHGRQRQTPSQGHADRHDVDCLIHGHTHRPRASRCFPAPVSAGCCPMAAGLRLSGVGRPLRRSPYGQQAPRKRPRYNQFTLGVAQLESVAFAMRRSGVRSSSSPPTHLKASPRDWPFVLLSAAASVRQQRSATGRYATMTPHRAPFLLTK